LDYSLIAVNQFRHFPPLAVLAHLLDDLTPAKREHRASFFGRRGFLGPMGPGKGEISWAMGDF
jgi:hypothetical protein